jgi:hypothetical protein
MRIIQEFKRRWHNARADAWQEQRDRIPDDLAERMRTKCEQEMEEARRRAREVA